MKRLLALLALLPALTWGQVITNYSPGQVLTSGSLNANFALAANVTNATMTNPAITNGTLNTVTLNGPTVLGGTITNTPISGASGSFTTLTASSTVTLPSGSIPLSELATQATNTLLANGTASTASPTALAVPSCSSASSALNWTTSGGASALTCNTAVNAATLSGNAIGTSGATVPLLNGANTWSGAQSFTSTITPSQTNGIVGTNTNNSANAGSVGEIICAQVTNGGSPSGCATNTSTMTSVPLSATATNVTSISLTAGQWQVCGNAVAQPAGTTTVSAASAYISTTSATLPSGTSQFLPWFFATNSGYATGQGIAMPLSCTFMKLASTTTVYLGVYVTFGVSTMSAYGWIYGERVR